MTQAQLDALYVGATVFAKTGYSEIAYEAREVVGETSRSWLIGPEWSPTKLPKRVPKGLNRVYGFLATAADVEQIRWVRNHGWKIGDAVRRCNDYDTMRQVASLVGYLPREDDDA